MHFLAKPIFLAKMMLSTDLVDFKIDDFDQKRLFATNFLHKKKCFLLENDMKTLANGQ